MNKKGDLKLILAFLGLAAALMFFRIITYVPEVGEAREEEGGIVQLSGGEILFDRCGEITEGGTYFLNQSISLNETCIIVSANGVTIDGRGHKITGNGSWTGIEITGKSNIIVKDIIVENYSNGIFIEGGNNWLITDSAFNRNNDGIQVKSSGGTISRVSAENNAGIGINISGDDNLIADSSLKSYRINAPGGVSYGSSGKAEVKFLEEISANGTNFANDIKLDYNYAYVDASKTGLNKSAEITFYNLPMNMAKPIIFRNGIGCNATTSPSCANSTSLNAGNVTFEVSGWSSYTIHDEDVTPPAIEFVAPSEEDNARINRNNIKINVSVNEPAFASLVISLFNSTGLKNSTTWTINNAYVNIKGLKEGTYYFNASATDNAGNEASSETRKVIIDTSAPGVTIHSPRNITYTSGNYVVNISLNEKGICEYGFGSGSLRYDMIKRSSFDFFDVRTDSNGAYTLIAYCEDSAGNENYEESVSFRINVPSGGGGNQQTNTTNTTRRTTTTTRTTNASTTSGTSKSAEKSNLLFYLLLSAIIVASAGLVIIIVMVYVLPSIGKPAWQRKDITPLAKFNYLIDDIERALAEQNFKKINELYPNIGLFFRYLSADEQLRVKGRAEKIYYDIEMARRSAGLG